MSDRENVIKGLELCSDALYCADPSSRCSQCPYRTKDMTGTDERNCSDILMADALAMLKEQEAVEPIPFFTETGAESPNYVICGHCKSIKAIMPKYTKQKYCHECGFPVFWGGR